MHAAELMLIAQAALGYVWQWTRALKKVPNEVGYGVFGVSAVLIYIFATPDFGKTFHESWRTAVAGAFSFLLAARGSASASSDTKVAAKTNSL